MVSARRRYRRHPTLSQSFTAVKQQERQSIKILRFSRILQQKLYRGYGMVSQELELFQIPAGRDAADGLRGYGARGVG